MIVNLTIYSWIIFLLWNKVLITMWDVVGFLFWMRDKSSTTPPSYVTIQPLVLSNAFKLKLCIPVATSQIFPMKCPIDDRRSTISEYKPDPSQDFSSSLSLSCISSLEECSSSIGWGRSVTYSLKIFFRWKQYNINKYQKLHRECTERPLHFISPECIAHYSRWLWDPSLENDKKKNQIAY